MPRFLFFLSSVYYTELIDIWEHLSIHPIHPFIQGGCSCQLIISRPGALFLKGKKEEENRATGGLPDRRLSARAFGRFCGTFSAMAIDNAAIVAGRRRRRSKRRRTTSSGRRRRRRRRSELVGSLIFSLL